MSKHIYIEVPCKPIVAQYIHNRYGSPVVFPSGDWLKLLFCSFLGAKLSTGKEKHTLGLYTQKVKIPIELWRFNNQDEHLSNEAIAAINNRIEDEIHQRLFIIFEHYHATIGYTIKQTAQKFQELYNFPEEIYSTDNILKQYQRNIREELRKKNIQENVLRPPFEGKKHPNRATKQATARLSAMKEVLEKYPITI